MLRAMTADCVFIKCYTYYINFVDMTPDENFDQLK